jgi:hypothetical protein
LGFKGKADAKQAQARKKYNRCPPGKIVIKFVFYH